MVKPHRTGLFCAMSLFRNVISGRSQMFRGGPPAPEAPFFAIGDVHGRYDLLKARLDALRPKGDEIVLVGDYVDRGDQSAEVLALLYEATQSEQVICVRGNHEEMLIKFVERPRQNGRIWLRFGGLQTLASYGIGGLTEESGPHELIRARDALVTAMGDTLAWLRGLPYLWQSGNVAVVHAGADPHLSLDAQPQRAMAWGHPDFEVYGRKDGIWIIYGHVIVPEPLIENGRAGIDTGAYATGRLTAVRVEAGAITPV